MAGDGEVIEPVTVKRRKVEPHYLGLCKVKNIEDSESEHKDEKKS